jgi:Recombination directionality factor-like
MPINGLTGSVRTLRTAKLKLGYTEKGKKFPSDKDVFVGKVADGVTREMIAAYDAKPVPDAKDAGIYNFGRELRGMLAFEYDAMHEGHEVALELLNRSWATSRIRCSGTGGSDEEPGEAFVRNEQYADVLRRRGLLLGERRGGWAATCLGRDCDLWHDRADDTNKLPGCHREMRLHFILLHPTRDENDPSYMQQLGWIEVATGSWNGAVDVQSGFAAIRALAGGRTALIPFRLRRVLRSVSAPNGRVNKATLLVDHWADEVLIFASGPAGRAILRPALRKQLAELAAAEASWAALPAATFASVTDIQPQPDRRALPQPAGAVATLDREESAAAAGATRSGPDESDPADAGEVVRMLANQDELDEVKIMCGGTPGQRDTLGRFYELVEASYEELGVPTDRTCGTWQPYPERREGAPVTASWLTTKHRAWIEERVAAGRDQEGAGEAVEGELVDPDEARS